MNLNPYKKRNEKADQIFAATCADDRERLEKAIKEAEALKDPAEKVLALQRIQRGKISNIIASHNSDIVKETAQKGSNAALSVMTPVSGGSLVASVVLTHGLSLIAVGIAIGGLYASSGTAGVRKKIVHKKLTQRAASHMQYLNNLQIALSDRMAELVRENVSAISKSPLRDNIMQDNVLSKTFSEAAANHVIKQEEENAVLKAAQKGTGTQKKTGLKTGDYNKLKNPLHAPKTAQPTTKRRANAKGQKNGPDGIVKP